MGNKQSYTYRKYSNRKLDIQIIGLVIAIIAFLVLPKIISLKGRSLLIGIFIFIIGLKMADTILTKKRRRNYTTWGMGAGAELTIGRQLERLGTEYELIHDLQTGRGNIDHICVGPTGVFAIETNAHSGTISYTDKLLINGQPPEKDFIKQVQAETYYLRDLLRQKLGREYSIIGILEFPHAKIDDSIRGPKQKIWIGGSGFANYVIQYKGSRLTNDEIKKISQVLKRKVHPLSMTE